MPSRNSAVTATAAPRLAAAADAAPSFDQDGTLDNLREIYIKLDWAPTHSLSPDDQNQWFVQYNQTRQAIIALESKTLETICAALGAEGPAIATAIGSVEKSLHGMQDTAQIICAVGIGLEAITRIASIAL